MSIELYPIVNSGFTFYKQGNFSGQKDANGKICAIQFINSGNASNVTLEFNGATVIIVPGDVYEITAPLYAYDATTYSWYFTETTGVGTRVDKLDLQIQQYKNG